MIINKVIEIREEIILFTKLDLFIFCQNLSKNNLEKNDKERIHNNSNWDEMDKCKIN